MATGGPYGGLSDFSVVHELALMRADSKQSYTKPDLHYNQRGDECLRRSVSPTIRKPQVEALSSMNGWTPFDGPLYCPKVPEREQRSEAETGYSSGSASSTNGSPVCPAFGRNDLSPISSCIDPLDSLPPVSFQFLQDDNWGPSPATNPQMPQFRACDFMNEARAIGQALLADVAAKKVEQKDPFYYNNWPKLDDCSKSGSANAHIIGTWGTGAKDYGAVTSGNVQQVAASNDSVAAKTHFNRQEPFYRNDVAAESRHGAGSEGWGHYDALASSPVLVPAANDVGNTGASLLPQTQLEAFQRPLADWPVAATPVGYFQQQLQQNSIQKPPSVYGYSYNDLMQAMQSINFAGSPTMGNSFPAPTNDARFTYSGFQFANANRGRNVSGYNFGYSPPNGFATRRAGASNAWNQQPVATAPMAASSIRPQIRQHYRGAAPSASCNPRIKRRNSSLSIQVSIGEEQFHRLHEEMAKAEAALLAKFPKADIKRASEAYLRAPVETANEPIDRLINKFVPLKNNVMEFVGKIDKLRIGETLPDEIHEIFAQFNEALSTLYQLRLNALQNHGSSLSDTCEKELVTVLAKLTQMVKRSRSALWCAMVMTVNRDLANEIQGKVKTVLSRDDWWSLKSPITVLRHELQCESAASGSKDGVSNVDCGLAATGSVNLLIDSVCTDANGQSQQRIDD